MAKKKNKLAIALGAIVISGALFVGGSAIAAAANERSLVDEWKSWGQVEQQVETPEDDDINTDVEAGDDTNTEAGDQTNTETGDDTNTEGE